MYLILGKISGYKFIYFVSQGKNFKPVDFLKWFSHPDLKKSLILRSVSEIMFYKDDDD